MSSSRSSASSRSASMKQGKLEFATSKRTVSGLKKAAGSAVKGKGVVVSANDKTEVKAVRQNEDIGNRVSGESSALHEQHTLPVTAEEIKRPEAPLELDIKDPRWRKLFTDAKEKRGGLSLVHGKDQNQVHQILRVFDLNYDYGPCIGVTRLERWERADALGLNPPPEIRDMLLTREGLEQTGYSECVFYDEV